MRKRKLYLSEFLKRCQDKERKVHIGGEHTNLFYDNVIDCLQQIKDSYLWNKQVLLWCYTTYTYPNNKRDKVICIRVEED